MTPSQISRPVRKSYRTPKRFDLAGDLLISRLPKERMPQESFKPALEAGLLAGGGELGRLMRAMDWSRTALGPVEMWPQALRTSVRILLTSRQPMFPWWGDELINLYNDAYKSIVGGKHPWGARPAGIAGVA